MKVIGGATLAAALTYLAASSSSTEPWIKGLASVGAALLLWFVFYAFKFITVPASNDAEAAAHIAQLTDAQNATPQPKPIDLARISNLMTLWGDKCLRMRSKHGMQPNAQRQWARELLADIQAIYGQEAAYIVTRRFPQLLADGTDSATLDGYMKIWTETIGQSQQTLTAERVSREAHPDIMAYVDMRLIQLRAELDFKLPS